VTVLGGGVDEFNFEVLGLPGLGSGLDRLSEDERSLARSHNSTLDEDEIFVDLSVVRESTHGGDVLLNGISLAGSVVNGTTDGSGSNSVKFLVDFGSGVVTHSSSSANSPLDSSGMPGSDTSDLSETSVRFSLESLASVSLDDTLHSLSSGNTDGVNALVGSEDIGNVDLLLEVVLGPLDLVSDGTTVNLDFHDVVLVLSESELADLGGAEDSDDLAVLADSVGVSGNGALVLGIELVLLGVLGEGLLGGVAVVSVHASLGVFIEVLGPDGGELSAASWCVDVTDHTDNLHGGSLNNGKSVDDILLDHLFTFTTFLVLDTVSHTGLVSHEGGDVRGVGGVISRPGSNSSSVMASSSLGEETEMATSGVFKLTVRHIIECSIY